MIREKFVVTLNLPVKTGPDNSTLDPPSSVFTIFNKIDDVFAWAENEGIKNPNFSDLAFSEYTCE